VVRAEGATKARPALRKAVVPAPAKGSFGKRVAAKVFSGAALLFAGALLVGSSIPANAFYLPVQENSQLAYATMADSQQIAVSPQALAEATAARSDYKVMSYAERLAAEYGATNGNYSPTSGSVRWPFPYSVPTSDGYGPRAAPCAGCSTFHNGLDFLPGAGVPIYAVASGTVVSSGMDGSLGNKVELEHVIKGQAVESVYGHMAMNSSPLQPGDTVKVGDFIGLVGSTGSATAPHLHLEIHLSGVPVNPYTWLTANAR
jgi:murein DD-endopeptidase MepM/ murein hydrolase activator NlpD